jgi:hypothetical protein
MGKNKISLFVIIPMLALFTITGFWLYSNKAYYPALPFERGSKKEVVEKLDRSNNELVKLAKVDGFYWLGFRGNQQDGRDKVIKLMADRGLTYDSYEGAGIFFKNGERVIITGTMWTGDYVLYKVPERNYFNKENQ